MIYSLAPMEGLTGHVFRRVHAECFGSMERYYAPFISPRDGISFTKREQRDIDPANNAGLKVIPQLLTNDADAFVSAANRLADLGYSEVNLNLGCPSGTVVGKGKGSGFLARPQELETFLREICERSPLPVSVKTRLGLLDDSEFDELLERYCRCPLAELIVHPRVRKDMYQGHPRQQAFGQALAKASFPVAYSGDIFTPDDLKALVEAYPQTHHVMLGRGVLVDPALPREVQGGPALDVQELRRFHDGLFGEYQSLMGGSAVSRMKEWWFYAKHSFADPMAVRRFIRKTRTVEDYRFAVERVFGSIELAKRPSRPGE